MAAYPSPNSLLASWVSELPAEVAEHLMASVMPLRYYAGLSSAQGIPTPAELGAWLYADANLDPAITKSKILTFQAHVGPELDKRANPAWWKAHDEHIQTAARNTVNLLIEEGRPHFLAEADRLRAGLPAEQAQWSAAVAEWREMLGGQLSPGSIDQWCSEATSLWLARGFQ